MLHLFKSKKVLIGGGVALAALAIGGGIFAYSFNQYAISLDEAQSIALESAGVAKSEVTFTRSEKDLEDGQKTYDIEFYTADGEYAFTIDGTTGSILERDVDITTSKHINSQVAAAPSSTTQATSSSESTASTTDQAAVAASLISEEQAKEAALKHAGLAESAVSQLTIQLDMENGQQVYEVDFNDTTAGLDYDYTIDAVTGEIVEHSKESLVATE
ncbi:PepSY domain-containing protein [Streptococcus cameli]